MLAYLRMRLLIKAKNLECSKREDGIEEVIFFIYRFIAFLATAKYQLHVNHTIAKRKWPGVPIPLLNALIACTYTSNKFPLFV